MMTNEDRVYNILRSEVATQVGYTREKNGDSLYRVYGTSDDHILELCANLIVERLGKSIGALL